MRNLLLMAGSVLIGGSAVLAMQDGNDDDGSGMSGTKSAETANHLINETSPYLLQHAHNPVDWYPWGPEAFEEAKRRQVPILVSIGYATCYWCHVMERESFEDPEVALIMNQKFVCIKVDREERPDVDDIYMAAVVAQTGQGGWPMNVFLTPPPPDDEVAAGRGWTGLQPFWGGTYFPPQDMNGRASWTRILEAMSRGWATQRRDVLYQADQTAEAVRNQIGLRRAAVPIDPDLPGRAMGTLMSIYDQVHGGFGIAPKFPQPLLPTMLMEGRDSLTDPVEQAAADKALSTTLDRMAMGGMYDQIGGGFHRYSTDAKWLVPHFEKMLYDNGQLASLYAAAAQASEDPYYERVARQTCEYVLREMTDPKTGAFYSAQDAEVNSREGQNYLWTPDQVREALVAAGEDELVEFALDAYGLSAGTNFQDPHHRDEPPSNVIHLTRHPQRLADEQSVSIETIFDRLNRINAALLPVRDQRDQPLTDDKIIASWNGLMMAGLADTGRVLDESRFIEAARQAWTFIDAQMSDSDGGLLRTYRVGQAKTSAFLEDYAFLAHGLLAMHDATGDTQYVDDAIALMDQARELFRDDQFGGYFDTREDQDDLFVRTRSTSDGALPSPNGVMLHNLYNLHRITGQQRFLDDAMDLLGSAGADIRENPLATVNTVRALMYLMGDHADRIAQIGADAQPVFGAEDDPVEISASPSSLALAPGEQATIQITLTIDSAYHINAHDPGAEGLVGLSLIVDGGSGYTIDADYPEGVKFGVAGQEIFAHGDSVTIDATIKRTGDVTGREQLMVRYQACTSIACMEAQKDVVPVQFDSKP